MLGLFYFVYKQNNSSFENLSWARIQDILLVQPCVGCRESLCPSVNNQPPTQSSSASVSGQPREYSAYIRAAREEQEGDNEMTAIEFSRHGSAGSTTKNPLRNESNEVQSV
jgi:hypothetical protein